MERFDVKEQLNRVKQLLTEAEPVIASLRITTADYIGYPCSIKRDDIYLSGVSPKEFPWGKLQVDIGQVSLGKATVDLEARLACVRLTTEVSFEDLETEGFAAEMPTDLRRRISEAIIKEVESFVSVYGDKPEEWKKWRMQEPSLQRAVAVAKSLEDI